MRAVSSELKGIETELAEVTERRDALAATLPNLPDPAAPDGGEDEGVTLREVGARPSFEFEVRDHLELGLEHGWIEVEKAAAASGSRFAYLLGDLVMVELALVRFAVETVRAEGFEPVVPPVLVRDWPLYGTGFFPGEREMIYEVERDEPLPGRHLGGLAGGPSRRRDRRRRAACRSATPGISTCFRREAGAAGKDTRGIFRVHQFDKVEMFSFVAAGRVDRRARADPGDRGADPRRARDALPRRRHRGRRPRRPGGAQVRLRGLDPEPGALPRADLVLEHDRLPGAPARRPLPPEPERLPEVLHTLNGTAVAVGRTLIALIENGQRADGAVDLPAALVEAGAPERSERV